MHKCARLQFAPVVCVWGVVVALQATCGFCCTYFTHDSLAFAGIPEARFTLPEPFSAEQITVCAQFAAAFGLTAASVGARIAFLCRSRL